jgi:hypothetical protein
MNQEVLRSQAGWAMRTKYEFSFPLNFALSYPMKIVIYRKRDCDCDVSLIVFDQAQRDWSQQIMYVRGGASRS